MPKRKSQRRRSVTLVGPVMPAVVSVRAVSKLNQLLLFVRAGGRCEFDGCNRDVLRHHLTLTEGNFAQVAHIVAFRQAGPRGNDSKRPANINDVRNLMLLCPQCHKLIDDHPGKYSRRTLEEYKVGHERRIRYVTGLGPDRETAVIILKSRIGGHLAQVPFAQIVEATAPRYPSNADPGEIDLSGFDDTSSGFIEAAQHEIAGRVQRFFEPGGAGHKAQHLSVFPLAPIPLLVFFGRQLSNKVPSEVHQRHRDTEDWTWKKTGTPVSYVVRRRKIGSRDKVALMLSLSGTIPLKAIPQSIRESSTIYEITLRGQDPAPTFLRLRQDLEGFRVAFQEVIGTILKNHGLVPSVDLFPAVPAPVAVLCGRELLPKVHPRLRVYDYDKTTNGFTFKLEV
jgi:SMODS-associated and fused to various effectors sensor domain/HNH endonuclease